MRQKNKDHIRRARIKDNGYEHINFIKVFDEAKWKCKMCGSRTPKTKMGTMEDNAPTLDHIIHISKGGSHTYNNVQLLCRHCNCIVKRDSVPTIGMINVISTNVVQIPIME